MRESSTASPASSRPIDQRFRPPVKGIDLAQALNYLDLAATDVSFIYDHYTSAQLFYEAGRRPELEAVAKKACAGCSTAMEKAQVLATFVAEEVPWAGFYEKQTGEKLPGDRGLSEEEIIKVGYGWCNEQARLFCCLTQVVGICSRLVFASNKVKKYGHVVCEVFLDREWMMVDQSMGYLFAIDGQPVRAVDVFGAKRCRAHFEPIYRELCKELIAALGRNVAMRYFGMATADNPLDVFKDLGFHNHFVS